MTARIPLLRAVATALVLTFAVGTGVLLAADPTEQPTVGGTLSAAGREIVVLSHGNVPATVDMTATDVALSETRFTLMPGEAHTVTFTGPKATGTVTAVYTVVPTDGQDSGSATLTLGLDPVPVPPPSPLGAILFWITVIGGIALVFTYGFLWARRHLRYVPASSAPRVVPERPQRAPHRPLTPVGVHAYLKPADPEPDPEPDPWEGEDDHGPDAPTDDPDEERPHMTRTVE